MISREDVRLLRCPESGEPLVFRGRVRDGALWQGELVSGWTSQHVWPVQGGQVVLFRPDEVGASDRFMNRLYQAGAALHDPLVRYGLPAFQVGGTEHELRSFMVERMRLHALTPPSNGRPVRILEVSVGTGANLSFVRDALPSGLTVEWWGLDLSPAMMRRGERRARRLGLDLRTVLADAHHLPFADHTFDRVFHVGAINAFHDQAAALSEMGRVARPGTPIVVVDEQLDESLSPGPYRRAMFALVTFYDDDPRSPAHLLPPDAIDVQDEQGSAFFYCLTFAMPG